MAKPAEDSPPVAGEDARSLWKRVAYLFKVERALRALEIRPPGAGKVIWGGENVVLEIAPTAGGGVPDGLGKRTWAVIVNGAFAYADFVSSEPRDMP